MNESPKVSIVLPTYNGSKYIQQSINSCLNQSYQNIELIIVDDGSTDGTSEIISSYKDDRVKYLRHEKNNGLPHALNTGFSDATGDYLTWTSDDNLYAEVAIEKMLSFLKYYHSHFVYCDFYKFKDNDLDNKIMIKLPDRVALENGNTIGPCFLYSREVMKVIGKYDPQTALAEDYDYWIRVSRRFPMSHLKEAVYFYRVHNKSLYLRKFYEVKIVDLLVRIKNNISTIDSVTDLLISLIAQKRVSPSNFDIPLKSCLLFKLNKIFIKFLISKKIRKILKEYKMGKYNFSDTKVKLKNIVDGF